MAPIAKSSQTEQIHSNDIEIAVLQQQVIALREKQESDHRALQNLQRDRDRALIWGLIVMGSTVLSLAAWIMKNILKVL